MNSMDYQMVSVVGYLPKAQGHRCAQATMSVNSTINEVKAVLFQKIGIDADDTRRVWHAGNYLKDGDQRLLELGDARVEYEFHFDLPDVTDFYKQEIQLTVLVFERDPEGKKVCVERISVNAVSGDPVSSVMSVVAAQKGDDFLSGRRWISGGMPVHKENLVYLYMDNDFFLVRWKRMNIMLDDGIACTFMAYPSDTVGLLLENAQTQLISQGVINVEENYQLEYVNHPGVPLDVSMTMDQIPPIVMNLCLVVVPSIEEVEQH